MTGNPDAVIVGSGPNGLAAAVTLSAAGLKVLVLEGAATAGGGCRTDELTLPGFRHDVCSAAHPLAAASPFFRRFDLAARGVRLACPEIQLAHPLDGGRSVGVTRPVQETAGGLGADAVIYRRTVGRLAADPGALGSVLLSPLGRSPRHPRTLAALGLSGLWPAATLASLFRTDEARALLAGCAAHAIRSLTAPGTAAVALVFAALAHAAGWPVAEGGSGQITGAMVAAIRAAGGEVETGRWVRSLDELPRTDAVLLDVTPRSFTAIAGGSLPDRYREALHRYRYGPGVCKADFALSGPVPWTSDTCRRAGTLHLGGTFAEVAASEAAVMSGRHPQWPFVLAVQPGAADPSRAPAGKQTLWAYCHVPPGSDQDMTPRIRAQIERFAPGFGDVVLAQRTITAAGQEAVNPNYVGGDIASGAQTLRQLVLRPVPRWNPYRTPVRGVYLCSSATPPGPGVHGRCGELAALTALRDVFGIREPPGIGPAPPRQPAGAPHPASGSAIAP